MRVRDLAAFLLDVAMVYAMVVATTPGVTSSCVLEDGVKVLSTVWWNSKTSLPSAVIRGPK